MKTIEDIGSIPGLVWPPPPPLPLRPVRSRLPEPLAMTSKPTSLMVMTNAARLPEALNKPHRHAAIATGRIMGALRVSLNEERTGTDAEIILPRSEGHNRVEVMRLEEATRERPARGRLVLN